MDENVQVSQIEYSNIRILQAEYQRSENHVSRYLEKRFEFKGLLEAQNSFQDTVFSIPSDNCMIFRNRSEIIGK